MTLFWQKHFDALVERLRSSDLPLRLDLWNGTQIELSTAAPRVILGLASPLALRHLQSPSLGRLGQAYVEGELDVQGRITDIVEIAVRLADGLRDGALPWRQAQRLFRHTRRSDAEAIAYHYDVSNAFYEKWLDPRMVYSCAYFKQPSDSLEQAQLQKIDHILTKLRVQPGDRLLDIGCGWGALVIRAAEKFGARALGITLSAQQHDLACQRIAAAGLGDRCEVRLQDYRDVRGRFDRIASVGMFEHVGLKNLRAYFSCIEALLDEGGTVLNHGITSTDVESADAPLGGGEFIERYVFPQGELPHVSLALKEMCAAGLEPVDVENLRHHYAMTLDHWAARFEEAGDGLKAIAGEKRWRIWRMYLAGCAYGFRHHWINLYQVLALKAGAGQGVQPLTRDYMYR